MLFPNIAQALDALQRNAIEASDEQRKDQEKPPVETASRTRRTFADRVKAAARILRDTAEYNGVPLWHLIMTLEMFEVDDLKLLASARILNHDVIQKLVNEELREPPCVNEQLPEPPCVNKQLPVPLCVNEQLPEPPCVNEQLPVPLCVNKQPPEPLCAAESVEILTESEDEPDFQGDIAAASVPAPNSGVGSYAGALTSAPSVPASDSGVGSKAAAANKAKANADAEAGAKEPEATGQKRNLDDRITQMFEEQGKRMRMMQDKIVELSKKINAK